MLADIKHVVQTKLECLERRLTDVETERAKSLPICRLILVMRVLNQMRTDVSSALNQLVLHIFTMLPPMISTGKFANMH